MNVMDWKKTIVVFSFDIPCRTVCRLIFKDAAYVCCILIVSVEYWNGYRYDPSTERMTFDDAVGFCSSIGGSLVSIESAQENNVVNTFTTSEFNCK